MNMQASEKLADILLRKLDSLINPKIESRVIYGTLATGLGLIAVPRLIPFLGRAEIRSNAFELMIKFDDQFDQASTLFGFFLILIACALLYLFKIHNRPELVIKNVSPTAYMWKELPYSFVHKEYIHPKIINDLIGWISDIGQQIVSINLADSNNSNRYFGEIQIRDFEGRKFVEWIEGIESFSYEYLGTSESGVHVLHTVDCGGGSGLFHHLVFVVLEQDDGLQYEDEPKLIKRPLIRMIGRIGLGDRYSGKVRFDRGVLRVSKDQNLLNGSAIDKGFSIIVR